jgi:hypothetical protein
MRARSLWAVIPCAAVAAFSCGDERDRPPPCADCTPSSGSLSGSGGTGGGANVDVRWLELYGDEGEQIATSVAVDADGNVYFAGYYRGVLDFGVETLSSPSGRDIFLAKLDGDGGPLWAHGFGQGVDGALGGSTDIRVTVDASGNVYVAGRVENSTTVGRDNPSVFTQNAEEPELFAAKLNSEGAVLWAKHFADGGADPAVRGIAVDADGNLYLVGDLAGTADFLGTELIADARSAYVAKLLAAAGDLDWVVELASSSPYVTGRDIAVDPAGNTLVVGEFEGTLTTQSELLEGNGRANDIFVLRFDGGGTEEWAYSFGDDNEQRAPAVTFGFDGNGYVAGSFAGELDLGSGPLPPAPGSLPDMFVAGFDAGGAVLEAVSATELEGQEAHVVRSADGSIVVAGFFEGELGFTTPPIETEGNHDGFIVSFAGLDSASWSKRIGGPLTQFVADIALGPGGRVTFVGNTEGDVEIGGTTVPAIGALDIMIGQFEP